MNNLMLARFDWQARRRDAYLKSSRTIQRSWVLLALAAISLFAWLVYRYLLRPEWLRHAPGFFLDSLSLLEAAAAVTLCAVGVIFYWQQLRKRVPNAPTVQDLYALSPAEFERYVANLFQKRGYSVRVRGRSGDHGVDLELARPDGRRAIVQCKRYRNTIGPDIVRELLGTMIHEQVHHAFLVTTAEISPAAREWAEMKPITLIDGAALVELAAALAADGRQQPSAWNAAR